MYFEKVEKIAPEDTQHTLRLAVELLTGGCPLELQAVLRFPLQLSPRS